MADPVKVLFVDHAEFLGGADSVIPGLVNALLARHNLNLLGLRGQAKSRILRALTSLFRDSVVPVYKAAGS